MNCPFGMSSPLRSIAKSIWHALDTALAQVAELLDLRTGWIWLLREVTGEPYLAATTSLPPALIDNPQWMAGGSCYCLDTFRSGVLNGAANVNVVACTRLKDLVDCGRGE